MKKKKKTFIYNCSKPIPAQVNKQVQYYKKKMKDVDLLICLYV